MPPLSRLVGICLLVLGYWFTSTWHTAGHSKNERAYKPMLVLATFPVGEATPSPTPTSTIAASTPTIPKHSETLTPHIIINPASGPPQTQVTLAGSGFTPNHILTVVYIGTKVNIPSVKVTQILATSAATANGEFLPLQITLPATLSPGEVAMLLIKDGAESVTSTVFGVTPLQHTLTVRGGSKITAGVPTELSGFGITPQTHVILNAIDAGGALVVSTAAFTSTATGELNPITITVPLTATSGLATINAIDTDGTVIGMPITIVNPFVENPAPTLQMQTTRASIGTSLNIRTNGFSPGEPLLVSLYGGPGIYTENGSEFDIPQTTPLIADATGSVQTSLTVPKIDGLTQIYTQDPNDGTSGSLVTISLRGSQSGVIRTGLLVITGSTLKTIPSITSPGHPYLIIGEGFGANEQVTLTSQLTACPTCTDNMKMPIGTVQAGDDGIFRFYGTATTTQSGAFNVQQELNALGRTTSIHAKAQFTVTTAPGITVQPIIANPGQTVQIRGVGFDAQSIVHAQIGAGVTAIVPPEAKVDDRGAFVIEFIVPAAKSQQSSSTTVPVTVQDTKGNEAQSTLTISTQPATIHASPLSVEPGQILTVQGSGFSANESIRLSLLDPNSSSATQPNSMIGSIADVNGNFTVFYTVPQNALRGSYLLNAVGAASGRSAVYAFVLGQLTVPTPIQPTSIPTLSTPTPTPISKCITNDAGAAVSYFSRIEAGTQTLSHITAQHNDILMTTHDLILANTSNQPISVTLAYLIYSRTQGEQSQNIQTNHVSTVLVRAHSTLQRSLTTDIGKTYRAALVVRASLVMGTKTQCDAEDVLGSFRSTLVMHRMLYPGGNIKNGIVLHGSTQMPGSLGGEARNTSTSISAVTLSKRSAIRGVFVKGSDKPEREYLDLFNPQTIESHVQLQFITAYGTVKKIQSIALPPFAIQRIDVGKEVAQLRTQLCQKGSTAAQNHTGNSTRSDKKVARSVEWLAIGCDKTKPDLTVSTVVTTTVPIVAQRTLLLDIRTDGVPADVPIIPQATESFRTNIFPYLSTLGKNTAQVTLVNDGSCIQSSCPNAQVEITALSVSGTALAHTSLTIKAGTRVDLDLARLVKSSAFSLRIESSQTLFTEALQTLDGKKFTLPGQMRKTSLQGILPDPCPPGSRCNMLQGVRVSVFNATTGSQIIRVTGIHDNGIYFLQSYQVAPAALLDVSLAAPAPVSGTKQPNANKGSTTTALGVNVTCAAQCTAIARVQPSTAPSTSKITQSETWVTPLS